MIHEIGGEVGGSLSSKVTFTGEGTWWKGASCPEDEKKATLTLPDLTIDLKLKLLKFINLHYAYDFSAPIYRLLGVTNPIELF